VKKANEYSVFFRVFPCFLIDEKKCIRATKKKLVEKNAKIKDNDKHI